MIIKNKDDLEKFYFITSRQYLGNLKTQLEETIEQGYAILYIHIDIDYLNDTVDTYIKRSKVNA